MTEQIDEQSVETHCPYCALQCGMRLRSAGSGTVAVEALDFPTNRGGLCRKGWTCGSLMQARDRIVSPLMKTASGEFREVSWQTALDTIAERLNDLRESHGPNAISLFGGGGLTNEKAYLLGKFARRVLGTRYIDYNGRFCMASAAVASQKALGIDRGLPFPLEDIARAELVIIAGSNPATTMPPVMQYFDQLQQNGGKLVVCDPRVTSTARNADLHLQVSPGSDAAMFNGLLHILIRDNKIDEAFVAEHTRDFDAVKRQVKGYWPDRVERLTGIGVAQLEQLAGWLGEAKRYIALSGRGIEQQVNGVNNDLALINISLALGQFGHAGSGFGCMTGQGNGQGGREHGQKSDQLPGYRRLDDPEARQWIASVWQTQAEKLPQPGVSACEMFQGFGEQIRALLVFAANPLVSAPNAKRVRSQLKKLDLLVVCDSFLSETAATADIVLPTAQWAEETGTMTNLEGRIILRQPLRPPPENVFNDIQILAKLTRRLGSDATMPDTAEDAFEELCLASKGGIADYSGVTYQRIQENKGLFWPCSRTDPTGTPRIFFEGFPTPDRRAKFHAVEYAPPSELPNEQYPFYITTGRLLLHYQSGAQTRLIPELWEEEPVPRVEINPLIAATYQIKEDDWVRVTTRRGEMTLQARLTRDIRMDTLFIPFHWGDLLAANQLTSDALDPHSRIPEFKYGVGSIQPVTSRSQPGHA